MLHFNRLHYTHYARPDHRDWRVLRCCKFDAGGCMAAGGWSSFVHCVVCCCTLRREIEGVTDRQGPRRLGPKRASKIRKLFALSKDDDVRQYVRKLKLVEKIGQKTADDPSSDHAQGAACSTSTTASHSNAVGPSMPRGPGPLRKDDAAEKAVERARDSPPTEPFQVGQFAQGLVLGKEGLIRPDQQPQQIFLWGRDRLLSS